MRILVATDHKYFSAGNGVFDTYCFDRSFFDDYRAVFEEVIVAARVIEGELPEHARRSDGDGVEFLPLPNAGGIQLTLRSGAIFGPLLEPAIRAADAVCVRVPSHTGLHACRIARRIGRPVMFEMIGDPEAALQAGQHGLLASLAGKWSAMNMRTIPPACVVGSYVSREHLQRKYPAGPRTVTDSISSIRLPRSWLQPARTYEAPCRPLELVLVASLVPVKCHDVLLRGVAEATRLGADLRLRLAGDGALRGSLEALAADLGIADRVEFLGHLSDREELLRLLDSSHLFVMTSATEGMPRAMSEAMSRGLPALGSDVGGIAELLPADQRFPAGDFARLGQMIRELQDRPDLLSQYSERSARSSEDYVSDVLSEKRRRLLGLLRQAAEERR